MRKGAQRWAGHAVQLLVGTLLTEQAPPVPDVGEGVGIGLGARLHAPLAAPGVAPALRQAGLGVEEVGRQQQRRQQQVRCARIGVECAPAGSPTYMCAGACQRLDRRCRGLLEA